MHLATGSWTNYECELEPVERARAAGCGHWEISSVDRYLNS